MSLEVSAGYSVGIAAGHFSAAGYDESARWFERALAENPAAVWINHNLAPAYALAGHKEHARRSVSELLRAFPDLKIAQVRAGLPFRSGYLDRVADGLESVAMRPQSGAHGTDPLNTSVVTADSRRSFRAAETFCPLPTGRNAQ